MKLKHGNTATVVLFLSSVIFNSHGMVKMWNAGEANTILFPVVIIAVTVSVAGLAWAMYFAPYSVIGYYRGRKQALGLIYDQALQGKKITFTNKWIIHVGDGHYIILDTDRTGKGDGKYNNEELATHEAIDLVKKHFMAIHHTSVED